MSENSIEFSLSIAKRRAVGFIPAWSLASLHPEVDWQTREVQMNQCSPQCKGCHAIHKEQASRRKTEARAVNVCQSGSPPEYIEDSEEDENPLQTCEVEYEQGDKLFVTRLLLEPTAVDLHITSTISQKLVKGAGRALETQKGLFTLPNCARGFESVFAKEDFNILRQQDHTIKLVSGLAPRSSKVYFLSLVEQKELDSFLEENLCTGRICPSKFSMVALVFFIKKKDSSCQGRVERERSDPEQSGVIPEWKRFDNKSRGTTLASARVLCLN